MSLVGRVALITGSARGIGAAIADRLAADGAKVAVADLSEAEARTTAVTIGGRRGVASIGLSVDVSSSASVAAAVTRVAQELGPIDILVNNAGITQPRTTLGITAADYDSVLDVSLRGTLYMSQAVIPSMQGQQSGSIICISSVSAQRGGGILGGPHYSAAKAGVLGLARAMAREYGADGIRVNSVTPGLIDTDISKGKIAADRLASILAQIPLGRIGQPDDVAGCVLFLATDLAKYCTGATLDVNGGMLIH